MSKRHLSSRGKSLLVLSGAGLIAGSGLWFFGYDQTPQASVAEFSSGQQQTISSAAAPDPIASQQKAQVAPEEPTQANSFRTPVSLGDTPFANSLEGTDIDGQLRTDAAGNLVVDLQTKDFFDYFLNTVGEVAPKTALDKIESLARDSLPGPAAGEVMALLEQYLDYKQQALVLGNAQLDPARQQDPAYQLSVFRQALNDLKQLRSSTFSSDTHRAFFGLEEAYGEYTLASLDLQQRTDLSETARNTLQAWHRRQLPDVIRQTETRLIEEEDLHSRRQAILAKASSPKDAEEQLRKSGMAPDQIDDVVAYLSEREQFEGTFDQYQAELTRLQQAGLAPADLAAQKDQLLESHFDDEQTRTWARLKSMESPSR